MSTPNRSEKVKSIQLSAAAWPPDKKTGKKEKKKKKLQKQNTLSLNESLEANIFIKKMKKEKGLETPTKEEEEMKAKRSSVQAMIKTLEKSDTKKRKGDVGSEEKESPENKTKNLVNYYDTLSGKRGKSSKNKTKGQNFEAKSRYTENLAKRNLLSTTEVRKIKRKVKKRKSQNRLRGRISNKRIPLRNPKPTPAATLDVSNLQNLDEKEVEKEVPKTDEEDAEFEIEREIIEIEGKLLNPNFDNKVRNFFAGLKPTGKPNKTQKVKPKTKTKTKQGKVTPRAEEQMGLNGSLTLFGVQGRLDSGLDLFLEEESTAKKRKPRKKEKEKEIEKEKEKEVSAEVKEEEIKEQPKQGFQELEIGVEKKIVAVNAPPPKKTNSLKRLLWHKDQKPVSNPSLQPLNESLKSRQGQTPLALRTSRKDQHSNQRGVDVDAQEVQSESSLSRFFDSKDPPLSPSPSPMIDTNAHLGLVPAPPLFDSESLGSLNTFQTKVGTNTVATAMSAKTTQSLNSVLDPLSYVFTDKYREDFDSFQQNFYDFFRNCSIFKNSRKKKDPSEVIKDAVKNIKSQKDFRNRYHKTIEDAVEDVESIEPVLSYAQNSSHPRSYETFILLTAVRKLGYETRYTEVWNELKKRLEVRLNTQCKNLRSDEISTLARLDALQASLVAMEDLHRIEAQIRGIFFRPCRRVVMNFLNSMKSNENHVFSDSTERTTYEVVKRLHRRLKRVILKENRLRARDVGLILVEGSEWVCKLCNQVGGPYSEYQKRLPNCKHIFHKECIDKWLTDHYICPICTQDADKVKARSLKPLSHFFFEFVYYAFLLFPLVGAIIGSTIAGISLFFQRNFDNNVVVDVENNGFLKTMVASYVLGFFIFGFGTQALSLTRLGTKEYDSELWLLAPAVFGLVWSPFIAFLLSSVFQDPDLVQDEDTLKEAWRGFGGLIFFYVLLIIFIRIFIKYGLPYFSWCFINFKESLVEATFGEKLYAAYFWCCCSCFYFCCFGDEESEFGDADDKDFRVFDLEAPNQQRGSGSGSDLRDEQYETEEEVNFHTFFATNKTKSRSTGSGGEENNDGDTVLTDEEEEEKVFDDLETATLPSNPENKNV